MYVVGSTLLAEFSATYPQAAGELRALLALLSEASAEALADKRAFQLEHVLVQIELNPAAGVILIKSVKRPESAP